MSWDVIICKFPPDLKSPRQLTKEFVPEAFGTRGEVAQSFLELFPNTNASNLSSFVIDGGDFSIVVNMGREKICSSFVLNVRGSDKALDAIKQITNHFKARALDCTTTEFLDELADPTTGFRQWREYRDRVMQGYKSK
jgi:hypothetical protein